MAYKEVAQLTSDGIFITTTLIQESPLQAGVYLYPPNTIDTLPDIFDPTLVYAKWNGSVYEYISLELTADPTPQLTPEQEFAMLRMSKMQETVDITNLIISTYTHDYSEPEKLSWPKQEAEAVSLLNDMNADAPLLRSMAISRGMDLITLRDKILDNVENYIFLSSLIIGTQQKYTDIINAYTIDQREELKALKIVFPI